MLGNGIDEGVGRVVVLVARPLVLPLEVDFGLDRPLGFVEVESCIVTDED